MHLNRILGQEVLVPLTNMNSLFDTKTFSEPSISKLSERFLYNFFTESALNHHSIGDSQSLDQFPCAPNGSISDKSPSISSLRNSIGPTTIFLRIPFIIVNSIQCQFGGSLSHIFQKIKKIVAPSFTNHNSTSAVQGPIFVAGASASVNHVHPNSVGSGSVKSMESITTALACSGATITQQSANDEAGSSAIANNIPSRISSIIGTARKYCPFSKSLICQIIRRFHDLMISDCPFWEELKV